MARAINEFTPLLVSDADVLSPLRGRRSVWQFVLLGALSLGVLSLFLQQQSPMGPSLDGSITLNAGEAADAAFLSSMETSKDPSVDPCVDFYQYACGGWLRNHEIPSDRPSIDASFYVVSEANKDTIQRIFAQEPPQIHQLYQSCLIDQEVDTEAVAFVAQLLENVHLANSTLELMEYAGEMDQSLGISSFFSLFVGADPQDPSTNVLQLSQGGLTLPSREYYLEESKVDAYAELFVDYVTKLFAVEGLDRHNVSEFAQAVLQTETDFAKISLPNAALRDPWATNKAFPFAEIAARYPFLMAYLNGIYTQEPFPMLHAIVATPKFFEAQNELLSDESLLPQLKNYLSFHLIDSFGAILGEYFRRASHEFHGTIQGAGALLPRDQFCVRLTTSFLGDELGEYYMKDVFGPDAKAAVQALVAEIEESLKALLTTEAWLDKVTYEAAVAKLDKVKNYIGGPDVVPPLPFLLQADAFFNNVKSLMQLSAAGTIQAINEPVDEQAWDMFPSTVNAYYDPSANKMVFPAAILQPPFYSAEHFPAAANFARIGMVMGHELSHGFDDQGRNYDGNGALRSWWTPSVSAEFAEKTQCLSAQYSTFPVVSIEDGYVLGTVNGNLTLGENIADNGGIHLAYEAYQLWKSTFAPPPVVPPTEILPETPSPPSEQIPVVTLPPPVLPVPEAEKPESAQSGPNGEIPITTLSPPPVVPEPQPIDIRPSPEEQTPAPTEADPPTEIPVATPPPPPAPEQQTPVPSEPLPEEPTSPAVIPVPVSVPEPPTSSPSVETKPGEGTPSPVATEASPEKHKHKKEKEPEEKEPSGKAKHHKGESDKDKKSDKSKPKDEENHKRSSEKHSEKDEKKPHGGGKPAGEDEGDKSSKQPNKHDKEEDEKHRRHDDEYENKGDGDKKHHKDKSDREKDEHAHDNDDDLEESGENHHLYSHEHHGEKITRERHRREEENKEESGHHGDNEEGHDRHGKYGHSDEEENGRHKHSKHERKEERREERKERETEEGGRHEHESKKERREERKERKKEKEGHKEERKEERQEERKEHKKEEEESKAERREERKERRKEEEDDDHHEKGKHHHRSDEEYDEYRESGHHGKHRRHEEECDECEKEEHKKHIRHHGCGKDESGCGSKHHKLALSDSESAYPFSGGDAGIHSMVERLARAIVQTDDPVADDRLFFTAFAQNWCEKRTPGYAELLRMIDPHSPGKWRVNGPLMNYEKFAEAFSCPIGTPMNPEKKCVIW